MLKRNLIASIIIFILVLIPSKKITNDNYKINYKNDSIPNIINKVIYKKSNKIASLDIPKLDLEKDIFNYNDKNNTVEKNVELLNGSTLPGGKYSIIFLAAHSGNSNISYFNNLDKLDINDRINFKYNGYKYTYVVDGQYLQDKDGDIEITSTNNYQLVLTTCSKKYKDKQLIINSNLVKKEKIS